MLLVALCLLAALVPLSSASDPSCHAERVLSLAGPAQDTPVCSHCLDGRPGFETIVDNHRVCVSCPFADAAALLA